MFSLEHLAKIDTIYHLFFQSSKKSKNQRRSHTKSQKHIPLPKNDKQNS